jgi:hypothetical protein
MTDKKNKPKTTGPKVSIGQAVLILRDGHAYAQPDYAHLVAPSLLPRVSVVGESHIQPAASSDFPER